MTLKHIVACLLLGSLVLSAHAQQNPFTGRPAPGGQPGADPAPPRSADADAPDTAQPSTGEERSRVSLLPNTRSVFPRLTSALEQRQRELHTWIGALIRGESARSASSPGAGLAVIGLAAFLYGMVHAALPGHRKILLVSYFVSQDALIRHGVLAGIGVAILHSGVATAIILGAYFLIGGSVSAAIDTSGAYLNAVTAGMIVLLGAVILAAKLREVALHLRAARNRRSEANGAGGHKPCAHHGHHEHDEDRFRIVQRFQHRIGLLPAIVLSAVIPCPGSALILMFAISLGAVWLGLYAVVVFSIGMALTLSAVSIAAIALKRGTLSAFDGPFGEALHIGLETFGALILVLFGTSLLLPYL